MLPLFPFFNDNRNNSKKKISKKLNTCIVLINATSNLKGLKKFFKTKVSPKNKLLEKFGLNTNSSNSKIIFKFLIICF